MAIEAVAGEPLTTYIAYRLPDATPITDANFVVVSAIRPDGTSFKDTVTIRHRENGIYDVVAPTDRSDPPGEWFLVVQAEGTTDEFQEVFDVTGTRRPTYIVQEIYRSGVSRREIRQMVAEELGDLVLVKATAEGTESSIVDHFNLALENRHYNGMSVRCIGGSEANVGRFATVTTSSQADRSINIIPPFPVATWPGDEFELTNIRGTGWRGQDYDNAINAAIRKAGSEHFTLPASVTHDEPFHRNNPNVSIPTQFAYFCGVFYTDRRGRRTQVPFHMYDVDRYSHTVQIRRNYVSSMNGARIHVVGRIEPPMLEEDEHRTPIPVDWLVSEVKAILQNGHVSVGLGQTNRDRLFYMDRQGADSRRTLIIPSLPPNTIKLR